jgi:hypothetical protein
MRAQTWRSSTELTTCTQLPDAARCQNESEQPAGEVFVTGILIVFCLVMISAAVAVLAKANWPRLLMASLLLAIQLVIVAFTFDLRARLVLVEERQIGSKTPTWEVVRKVGESQLADRACAGLTGLGLFLLVILNRRR